MRGINDRRFISSPIHIPNQEDDDIEITVPEINVKVKMKFDGLIKIKKRKIITSIKRV